jgi:drug/metabolite transporter (DMT)-like permease
MSSGAIGLITIGLATNRIEVLATFGPPQWLAGMYLGVAGGALAFILWAIALQRTTPTRVATTITVQPVAAALLAAYLLGEPITGQLLIGLLAVFSGIWIATTEKQAVSAASRISTAADT